MYVYLAHFL